MSDTSVIVLFGLIVLVALVVGTWHLFRMWNSPDGERYNRMNLHGFFDSVDERNITAENRTTAGRDKS